MDVQFEILLKKYDQYETDRTSLERLKKENRELTEKQTALSVRLGELREQEMGLRALVKEFAEKIDREEKKQAEFEEIARTAENRDLSSLTQMTSEELEARYYALTKVISDSVEELRKSQTDWIGRISGKRTELKKKMRTVRSRRKNTRVSCVRKNSMTHGSGRKSRRRGNLIKRTKKIRLLEEKKAR